jgi:DNA-binding CsgD family transcriptional regulator/PAS domain-containing protein
LRESELLRLIDRIYEGAVIDHGWVDSLRDLAHAFRSDTGNIAIHSLPAWELRASAFVGIEQDFQHSYGALVDRPDMQQAQQRLIANIAAQVVTDEVTIPGSGFLQSSFYHDWMQPQGLHYHIIAILSPTGSDLGGYFLTRRLRAGAYDADAVAALKALHPHLSRAMQVHLRLAAADMARVQALEALDRLSNGVLLVDARCRVLWANRAAESLLKAGDGLTSANRSLACNNSDETRALHRLAAGCSAGTPVNLGGMLAIHRRSGRRPLSVLIAPLRGEHPFVLERIPTAIVFLADPDRSIATPHSHLRDLYGLTGAEVRTAQALLDADRLADVAGKLGVSLATVRTLLHRAYEKTDTRRQSELVRLLLTHRIS